MARDDDADEATAAAPKSGSHKNLILIIVGAIALVVVSVGGSITAMKLMGPDEPVKKTAKKKSAAVEIDAEADADADADADAAGDDPDAAADEADAEGEEDAAGAPTYIDFDQPFVVNFQDEGQLRYLQVTVSVMVTDPKAVEEVRRHMPRIRNNLVMLLSAQTREAMLSREGKEKLRKEAEAEVQKILREQTRQPGVKALYFTSFVMQ